MRAPDLQTAKSEFAQYSAAKATQAGHEHLRRALEAARHVVESSSSQEERDSAETLVAPYAAEFEAEARALFASLKNGWPGREVWQSFYGRARLFVEFGFREDAEFANLLDNFEMFAIFAKGPQKLTDSDFKSLRRIFKD